MGIASMPNHACGPRLWLRSCLAVEMLETRRVLSGMSFWSFLQLNPGSLTEHGSAVLRDLADRGWRDHGHGMDAVLDALGSQGAAEQTGLDRLDWRAHLKSLHHKVAELIDRWESADFWELNGLHDKDGKDKDDDAKAAQGSTGKGKKHGDNGNAHGWQTNSGSPVVDAGHGSWNHQSGADSALVPSKGSKGQGLDLENKSAPKGEPGTEAPAGVPTLVKVAWDLSPVVALDPYPGGSSMEPVAEQSAPGTASGPRPAHGVRDADPLLESAGLLEGARIAATGAASEPFSTVSDAGPDGRTQEAGPAGLQTRQAGARRSRQELFEESIAVALSLDAQHLRFQAAPAARVLIGPETALAGGGVVGNLLLQGSSLLAGGCPIDPAALERALEQYLGQLNELGVELGQSVQRMGASPWLLGLAMAGTAYEVVRRSGRESRRRRSLTTLEGRTTLTWIAGLPGSLCAEEA
jgi:hypothetical protein